MLADLPQIQGKQPDSKEEVWVAMALDRLKIGYIFQFDIFGGSHVRGGIMIDFLVFNPFGIPVEVLGKYWHTGELGADDKLRQGIIEQYFNRKVVNLWTEDLVDPDTTYTVVKRELA